MIQHRSHLKWAIILVLGVLAVTNAKAQEQRPTTNTTTHGVDINKKKERPDRRRIIHIIKNDTRNILYGNKCFEDFTRDRGYEYVVQPKGNRLNKSETGRLLHNFGAKFGIFFRNGPFWKIKEGKKKKECRTKSGDFVG